MGFSIFSCLAMSVSLVSVCGQDCDFIACTNALTSLAQQPGSFSVEKFEQGCSLFQTASACMQSKLRRCTVTELDRFTWDVQKDLLQLACNERRADYLEVAPCMNGQQNLAALERCNQQFKNGIRGGIRCSAFRAHMGCITSSVRSCGEKAVEIMHTVTYRMLDSLLKLAKIDGCSLGSTAVHTTNAGAAITVFCCIVSALVALYG